MYSEQHVLSRTYSAHKKGEGVWVIFEETSFIDRRGDRDDDSQEMVTLYSTQEAAETEARRLTEVARQLKEQKWQK